MNEVEDGILNRTDYPVRLPVFEGPLDLLLFLIRKNEIDIYDIPIEQVTRQYLDTLYSMEKMDLDVAGEFFVMASNLMYIKSRMLLPKSEVVEETMDGEEDIDPRWELVQQLLQYKKFKEAAHSLEDLIEEAQRHVPRLAKEQKIDASELILQNSDRIELWNVFNQVLRRLSENKVIGSIQAETVTVSDRMEVILETLKTRRKFYFSELFDEKEKVSVAHLISTFLALLELTRMKRLKLEQTEAFDDIECTEREEGDDEPLLPSEFDNPPEGAESEA